MIKAYGIKVCLSGEGADELFGGYLYFHQVRLFILSSFLSYKIPKIEFILSSARTAKNFKPKLFARSTNCRTTMCCAPTKSLLCMELKFVCRFSINNLHQLLSMKSIQVNRKKRENMIFKKKNYNIWIFFQKTKYNTKFPKKKTKN